MLNAQRLRELHADVLRQLREANELRLRLEGAENALRILLTEVEAEEAKDENAQDVVEN